MYVTASELERLRNKHRDGQITAAEFNVGKILMERLPEVYFHPAFEYLVEGTRQQHARMVARAVSGVCE